jgi:MFS transporter, CP family, cyanate transporter
MRDSAAPPVTPGAPPGRHRWVAALFVAGLLAMGFNLRAAIAGLPPVFPELGARLRLPPGGIAALAATPLLCFGLFSPLAAPASRRFGEERVLAGALAGLSAGLLLRGALPGALLFPGTVLACGAIAFMNVLLPSLVKRRTPAQAGWLIGLYLLTLNVGAVLAPLAAVPAYRASGGSLPLTLGVWALPAAAAALVWLPQCRFRTLPGEPGGPVPGRKPARVSRRLLAWQVMGFMGLQSLTYYAALSWLPILFRDRGTGAVEAGTLLAVMNLGNAVTALALPVLAHRAASQRFLTTAVVAASAAGLAGVWFAPLAGAAAWTLLLGLGQGGTLGLGIYFMTARAADPASSASLSAFAQGPGYLIAATGPLLTGLLHTASGGWAVPVLALMAVFAVELLAGWLAARDRVLPSVEATAGAATERG